MITDEMINAAVGALCRCQHGVEYSDLDQEIHPDFLDAERLSLSLMASETLEAAFAVQPRPAMTEIEDAISSDGIRPPTPDRPVQGGKQMSDANAIKPYTSADLIALAVAPGGPKPRDTARALATYADPANWVSVHADDGRGMRHYWAWAGPVIVGYELAAGAIKDQDRTHPEVVAAQTRPDMAEITQAMSALSAARQRRSLAEHALHRSEGDRYWADQCEDANQAFREQLNETADLIARAVVPPDHVAVPIKRIDSYHVDAVLALSMESEERLIDLAVNIEDWFTDVIEKFREQNSKYWAAEQNAQEVK